MKKSAILMIHDIIIPGSTVGTPVKSYFHDQRGYNGLLDGIFETFMEILLFTSQLKSPLSLKILEAGGKTALIKTP